MDLICKECRGKVTMVVLPSVEDLLVPAAKQCGKWRKNMADVHVWSKREVASICEEKSNMCDSADSCAGKIVQKLVLEKRTRTKTISCTLWSRGLKAHNLVHLLSIASFHFRSCSSILFCNVGRVVCQELCALFCKNVGALYQNFENSVNKMHSIVYNIYPTQLHLVDNLPL